VVEVSKRIKIGHRTERDVQAMLHQLERKETVGEFTGKLLAAWVLFHEKKLLKRHTFDAPGVPEKITVRVYDNVEEFMAAVNRVAPPKGKDAGKSFATRKRFDWEEYAARAGATPLHFTPVELESFAKFMVECPPAVIPSKQKGKNKSVVIASSVSRNPDPIDRQRVFRERSAELCDNE
jgi:hypothetical protein